MSPEKLRRFSNKALFAFLLFFLLPAVGPSHAALPDGHELPEGWSIHPVIDKPLANNSANGGRWLAYELRSPTGDPVLLQLLPETESGPLHIPEASTPHLDGLLGMGATYSTINEESFKAVLETHPYLGNAVSAPLPSGGTIILESKVLPVHDLLMLCRFFTSPAPPLEPAENTIFVVP
ncbi:MAG: hypothetical protein ACC613_11365 [Synergistales bacterium]